LGAPTSRSTLPESSEFPRSIAGIRSTSNYNLNSDRFLVRMLVPVESETNWCQFGPNLDELTVGRRETVGRERQRARPAMGGMKRRGGWRPGRTAGEAGGQIAGEAADHIVGEAAGSEGGKARGG
jgi:hypothetical protein